MAQREFSNAPLYNSVTLTLLELCWKQPFLDQVHCHLWHIIAFFSWYNMWTEALCRLVYHDGCIQLFVFISLNVFSLSIVLYYVIKAPTTGAYEGIDSTGYALGAGL